MESLSIGNVWSDGSSVSEPVKKEVNPEQTVADQEAKDELGPKSVEPTTENGSVRTEPENTDVPCNPIENGGGVSVDDFLNKGDKAETISADSMLEPLIPSKVLESQEAENGREAKNGPGPMKDISPNSKRDSEEVEEKEKEEKDKEEEEKDKEEEETSDLIST